MKKLTVKQNLKPLFLILHKKWFDEIKAGKKKKEFREMTEYWRRRIEGREYSCIIFQNGYAKNAPRVKVQYKGYSIAQLTHEHFKNKPVTVYALKLGEIIN